MRILPLILASLLALTACSLEIFETDPKRDSQDIYKIGIYQPLTGDDASEAAPEVQGIELAHTLYPSIGGKKIELIYADNKSDVFHGKLAAQKLVNYKVDLILGSYGNVMSMTGGSFFEEAGIPAIAITCSNPLVTKGNPYYFRVGPVDAYQAPVAASFVYEELKPKQIGILKMIKDDYGAALADSFTEKIEELDGDLEIVSLEVGKGLENLNAQLEKLHKKRIAVVYLPWGPEKALTIIEAAHEMGYKPQFVGTYLWHNDGFLQAGENLLEGIIFTDYLDASTSINEKGKDFLAAYKKHYGDEIPRPGAALGYDAYMLAYSTLKARVESGEESSLQELLAATKGFEGVTGNISFNQDGDPVKPMRITTVKACEFIEKTIAGPEESPEVQEDEPEEAG